MDFTLDDIIHGILRGNKKAPNAYYFRSFGERDPRNRILEVIINPKGLFDLLENRFMILVFCWFFSQKILSLQKLTFMLLTTLKM